MESTAKICHSYFNGSEKKVEKYFTSAPSASLAQAALHARLSSHGMASGSRRGIWRLSSKGVVRNKIWRKLKGIRCKRERRADDPSLQRQEQLDLTPAKDGRRVADAPRCTQESDGTTALGASDGEPKCCLLLHSVSKVHPQLQLMPREPFFSARGR